VVLFSRRSREAYAAEAVARGETYTFIDAWSRPHIWLKGEHAYLAPSGASVLLARCNLKHDIVEEAELTDERITGYRLLVIPNAAHLAGETIARIEHWLGGLDRRLIVTARRIWPPPPRPPLLHADGGQRLHGLAVAPGLAVRE
jgi:hypothetical protein